MIVLSKKRALPFFSDKALQITFILLKFYSFSSGLDASAKDITDSFFLINKSPNEPGPQLLAIAEEAFCR